MSVLRANVSGIIIEDYKKAGRSDYLRTLGDNDDAVKAYFESKQEYFITMARRSRMPVVYINSSLLTSAKIIDRIFKTWTFLA